MPRLIESAPRAEADHAPVDSELDRLTALWMTFWATRERPARNALILAYEPLVSVVLARLPQTLRAHWEHDDLRSFGLLGLVEAIDRFEAGSAVGRFPSYAMARVRGAIFDELRRLDWLPRTVRRRVITYRSTHDELSAELGRMPETAEVLEEMGVSGAEADDLLQAVQSSQLVHLQQRAEPDAGRDAAAIIDLLASRGDEGPEDRLLYDERIAEVRAAIAQLPERQRTVIALRFFGGLTQEQIGAMLGVSNSRVCQIESGAIAALRRLLEDDARARTRRPRAG